MPVAGMAMWEAGQWSLPPSAWERAPVLPGTAQAAREAVLLPLAVEGWPWPWPWPRACDNGLCPALPGSAAGSAGLGRVLRPPVTPGWHLPVAGLCPSASRPVPPCRQVHDYLRSKLCSLYENDCIFDKFECVWNGSDR